MGKSKRKNLADGEQESPQDNVITKVAKKEEKRLIIVLEDANLESCKTGKELYPLQFFSLARCVYTNRAVFTKLCYSLTQ